MSNSTNLLRDMFDEEGDNEGRIKPQTRLDLSVNPTDGSLLTAPLSLIINTATDALYNDLQNMATGQPLTLFIPAAEDANASAEKKDNSDMAYTQKSEPMASLPYQQRRHILASRVARHIQSLSHISSLVAANLPNSAVVSNHKGRGSAQPNIYALSQTPNEFELSQVTQAASQALEHVRTSWVSADTAQDALYFHHDSLWKIRSHPHDILGSMDVLLKGRWSRLSKDVKLEDRYRDSEERAWDEVELKERLKGAVRRKLFLGEIGNPSPKQNKNFAWNLTLEKDMVALRLNYGKSRTVSGAKVYPLEARVTVLSEGNPAPWSLLSVRIRTAVKTGESNKQLELSKEQMFGFHKICERAMMQEELRAKRSNGDDDNDTDKPKDGEKIIARPLEKLLHLCHNFSLSWQMEILSSQAESLQKGTWSSQKGNIISEDSGISVTPVRFFKDDEQFDAETGRRIKPLAYMAIHFWQVDDRNGKPKLDYLDPDGEIIAVYSHKEVAKRLTLEISAIPSKGFEVSLSGGHEKENGNAHVIRNVKRLLSSLQDPFQLSVSDALLSAVIICSERRCHDVKNALLKTRENLNADALKKNQVLPSWLHLSVKRGTISIGVNLSYDGPTSNGKSNEREPVVLFRLACDSRSGNFVATFPTAADLLRRLSCNDPSASEVQFLRQIKSTAGLPMSAATKRRALARSRESTGRAVREAFQSLTRSMDILGRRVGVGGEWDNVDPQYSESLREKSIFEAASDACVSLTSCAGIAAVYGVGALSIGIAAGTQALPDIGGAAITAKEGGANLSCMPIPPLSVIMNQELVEHHTLDINGGKSTTMRLERELCSLTASVSQEAIKLHLFNIVTQMESVTSPPNRLKCFQMPFELNHDFDEDNNELYEHDAKRAKLMDGSSATANPEKDPEMMFILKEVDYFAKILRTTWDSTYV